MNNEKILCRLLEAVGRNLHVEKGKVASSNHANILQRNDVGWEKLVEFSRRGTMKAVSY